MVIISVSKYILRNPQYAIDRTGRLFFVWGIISEP